MKRILQLFILLLVFNCSDNDVQNDNIDVNLVTGMDIRPDDFSAPIRLGNPNILTEKTIVFPNPTPTALSIKTLTSGQITHVWILEGNAQLIFQNTDFDSLLNDNLYSDEVLSNDSENNYTDLNGSNLIINLEDYEEGYYRVFIKVDGKIEWHNIYIGSPDIDELINFWN